MPEPLTPEKTTAAIAVAASIATTHGTTNKLVNGVRTQVDRDVDKVDALALPTRDKAKVIEHLDRAKELFSKGLAELVAAHDGCYALIGRQPPTAEK